MKKILIMSLLFLGCSLKSEEDKPKLFILVCEHNGYQHRWTSPEPIFFNLVAQAFDVNGELVPPGGAMCWTEVEE